MSGDDSGTAADRAAVVRQWFVVAERDIRASHACLDAPAPVPEVAAYLCRQAVQKLLKALLVLANVRFGKTRDLEALRDLALPRYPALIPAIDGLVALTPWVHTYRYPGMGHDLVPSVDELRAMLSAIEAFAAQAAGSARI